MKAITFRPLRKVKKTGKITVASYMGWRKVKCADYNKFELTIDNEYKDFANSEFVYNHKGELLYWFKLLPQDVYFFDSDSIVDLDEKMDFIDTVHRTQTNIAWKYDRNDFYICRGLDVEGVPTFNHWTSDYVADYCKDVNDFEPLTVETVRKWFGWFLLQLNNSYLKIGK